MEQGLHFGGKASGFRYNKRSSQIAQRFATLEKAEMTSAVFII